MFVVFVAVHLVLICSFEIFTENLSLVHSNVRLLVRLVLLEINRIMQAAVAAGGTDCCRLKCSAANNSEAKKVMLHWVIVVVVGQ